MSSVPDSLALLDNDRKALRRLVRVRPSELKEADYDALITEHIELVADALRQADILDVDAQLRLLARQFMNIDLLFAEVADGRLQRLVIAEDKLFRNADAHRTVLAQSLEYAHKLQYEAELEALISACRPEARALLEDHRESLAVILNRGDFLVLICGDRLQPSLVQLAKPFLDRRQHVLSRLELSLLSIALYRDEQRSEYVLVPNVVGAMARGERELLVRVEVRDEKGRSVSAGVTAEAAVATEAAVRRIAWNEETFFKDVATANRAENWADPEPGLHALVQFLRENGFAIQWGKGATFASFTIVAEPSGAKVGWVTSQANICVYRLSLADAVGEQTVHAALATLAAGLGGALNTLKKESYLPEDFNINSTAQRLAFCDFLMTMKNALARGA